MLRETTKHLWIVALVCFAVVVVGCGGGNGGAGSKSLKGYIHKDDRVIEVSFVTPTEEFADHEPAIHAAAESIEID